MAAVDWGAVAPILGMGVALLGGLVKLIVEASRLADEVKRQGDRIERLDRHQDGLMGSEWMTINRVASIEDWLNETQGYRPPRMIPHPPGENGTGP